MTLRERITLFIQALGVDIKYLLSRYNNSGQIKLNWDLTNRPNLVGFQALIPRDLPLNNSYTVSGNPTTTYPFEANQSIGGQNLIDPTTLALRELKAGQVITFRIKIGYAGKSQNQSGGIFLNIYNPNPSSSFNEFLPIPAISGITDLSATMSIDVIADSLSLDPLYGYKFRVETTFRGNSLEVFIENITAVYAATEIN